MKPTIFLIAGIFIYPAVAGQHVATDKISPAVIKAFNEKFAGATKASWEIENNNYEVEFKIHGSEKEATFDKNGKLLDTEVDIKISELPKEVAEAVAKQFAGYKVTEAEKVEAADGKTYYDTDISKGSDKWEARFTPKGELAGKWQEK